jgi:hypothetical protein
MDKKIQDILDSLSPEKHEQLLYRLGLKKRRQTGGYRRPKVIKTETMSTIVHEYTCEFCKHVWTVEHQVKEVCRSDRAWGNPLKLTTVCNGCKQAIVLGMAIALNIIKGKGVN